MKTFISATILCRKRKHFSLFTKPHKTHVWICFKQAVSTTRSIGRLQSTCWWNSRNQSRIGKIELKPISELEVSLKSFFFHFIFLGPILGLSIYLGQIEDFQNSVKIVYNNIVVLNILSQSNVWTIKRREFSWKLLIS